MFYRRSSPRLSGFAAAAAILAALATFAPLEALAQAYPFGSHKQPYYSGAIAPSTAPAQLDRATAAAYNVWKRLYVKPGCGRNQYHIKADTESGAMVVSESQGYGMLILPMMAGYDSAAQRIFDGLLRYYLAHTSRIDPRLMSGSQNSLCQDIDGDDSATDGDLDAAYGLLLADLQWGSAGVFNYRALARNVMAGLYAKNVNPTTKLVNLGDWVTEGTSKFTYATRSSDWMIGHFRAFAKIDARWTAVLAAHQSLITKMQADFAPTTGLLPDFVVATNTSPAPAPAGFLEGPDDGKYSYNACRDPWRIGVDALTAANGTAVSASRRISRWLRVKVANDPAKISDGYALNGTPLVTYNSMTFVAPFAVAAMTDSGATVFLNALWARLKSAPADGYYPDTLKLLAMITISRNWLKP